MEEKKNRKEATSHVNGGKKIMADLRQESLNIKPPTKKVGFFSFVPFDDKKKLTKDTLPQIGLC